MIDDAGYLRGKGGRDAHGRDARGLRMSRGWAVPGPGDLGMYLSFLELRERSCVALADRSLCSGNSGVRFSAHRRLLAHFTPDSGAIDGALFLGEKGAVHCLLPADPADDPEIFRFVRQYRGRSVGIPGVSAPGRFSVAGPDDSAARFERAAGFLVDELRSYRLMYRNGADPAARSPVILPTLPEGVEVRPARESDFDALCDLQASYEAEEVYDGARPSGSYIAMRVAAIMRDGSCRVAVCGGRLVGKANLNARGIRCDQVGGVFVAPERRGRGICAALVGALAGEADRMSRALALYVKIGNAPALRAYLKCGFSETGSYRNDECSRAPQDGA